MRLETPRGGRQASEAAFVAVVWPAPLEVVRRLVEVSERQGASLGAFAVLVGGSAMAAHGIRAGSRDIDLYTPAVADAAVAQVEAEYRARYGPEFRLDVTTVENVWGLVMIRDIAEAPLVAEIETATGRRFAVRALAVEDLFVLKVASGRRRDADDLPLLAPHTNADAIVARFNALVPGIGDRAALPGIADALVASLVSIYGSSAASVIDGLALSEGLKDDLREAHHAA